MSSSIKNLYQFRTTSKITQAQAAASTFTVGNDIFTNTAVSITAWSIQLTNRTGSIVELFTVTVAAWVATIATRWIKPDWTTDAIYQYERPKNTLCTLTVLENQIFDKWGSETLTWNITYTGNIVYTKSAKFPVYADATARDAWIPSPANGMMIYNTALWLNQQYIGGSWVDVDTGTATGNASETATWLVEIPTQTQADNGDDTLDTGAFWSITPLRAWRSIQKNAWIKWEDAGWDDAYVVTLTPAPSAYVDGMEILLKATTGNTGACSVNVNALGVKSIKTPWWNDPQNGDIPAGKWKRLRYNGTDFVIVDGHQATTAEIWSPEMATDAEFYTWTDATRYVNALQVNSYFTIIAWTNVFASANTERSVLWTTYTKVKEITILKAGTYTIDFDLRNGWATTWFGRVYKNWIAFGTEQSQATDVYTTKSENLTFAVWDLCQLYLKHNWAWWTAYAQNFRVKWALAVNPEWLPDTYIWTVVTN